MMVQNSRWQNISGPKNLRERKINNKYISLTLGVQQYFGQDPNVTEWAFGYAMSLKHPVFVNTNCL